MAPNLPMRSQLAQLTDPDAFWWATGIEDTFITAPHPATGRTLDEYELTDHYRRWRDDLALMASLGVRCARYGVPWHKIEPRRGGWDWRAADEPLEKMLELGVEPQVDLVHYGLPGWIENAYLNPDYPHFVSEYAARLGERFKGRIHWYTPLNEPRITAWYCGKIGWWPPRLRNWAGFVAVSAAIATGIQATVAALRAVDPEIVAYHVDATDLYETSNVALFPEVERRRNIVHLSLDLTSGRVDERHPLWLWLTTNGLKEDRLSELHGRATQPDVIGLNLYPLFSRKIMIRDSAGRLRIRMPYSETGIIGAITRDYWNRHGRPMMISEIATSGSVSRRLKWLANSVADVRTIREDGIPLVGYTWWPMFALVAWAWRQGRRNIADHLVQFGLWNLDARLDRIETPLVPAYRDFVRAGREPVGALMR